ncbi:MAG: NADH-quinone oxidoreductase subunit G [Planctomycetota bacterium]|jgi:NADH-quinone oxidoreductase subunit G
MTKIIVNGREVEADPKKPLIAACHESGVDVPNYCYHPGLEPVGSCRICQVEVKEGERPARVVVACRTPVTEGMVVNTESEGAHDARRACLEFLLKDHPLDCPICDKAGECTLQDYTYAEGQAAGQSAEPRQNFEKRKSLGDVVLLDQERCILCSRCVRFFEEVTGKSQLAITGLGSRSRIETFADRDLTGNYQGNITDLCPVGALTLKPFRFKARVWNLFKKSSTCGECSRGCSISVEVLRQGDVKRIRPRYNEAVNRWWICDTGRFAIDAANPEGRIPAVTRGYNGMQACEVDDALEVVRSAYQAYDKHVLIASPWMTVEEGKALKELAISLGAEALFASPAPNTLKDDLLHTGDPCPNRRGLEELGFVAKTPAELTEILSTAQTATLFGERIAQTIGHEILAELSGDLRLFLFDVEAVSSPALHAACGVATWVERTGTWVNIDGHKGKLSAARPAPSGVRQPLSLINALLQTEASTR